MGDILDTLRDEQRWQESRMGEEDSAMLAVLARLAANEIERLRREVDRLTAKDGEVG